MPFKKLRLAPIAIAALASLGAQAQSTAESAFSFSGFSTVGVVGTNTSAAKFGISGQPHGATESWSGEVDSKLGLQLSAKANQMFSGTVQVLSKQNGDGNFRPAVEWAFAKAQLSPSLGLRLGRMGGPFFAVSDFRDVGYANTWLRPPQDVYGQVPVSHFDGADAIYQTSVGSGNLSVQVFGGKSSSTVQHTDVDLKKLLGVNASLELDGGITLRAGHLQGKLSVHNATLGGLVSALRATPYASVGNQLDATDKTATFTGIGAALDQGDWIANFEYTMRRTDCYVPDTDGWYLTLGHRFGKLTPYATLSQLKQKDANVDNTIPAGVPALAKLKATVDGTLASQSKNQKTLALGMRWDAMRNIAVKGQIERVKPNGPGLFSSVQPGFGTGNTISVYSLSVDMVF